MQRSFLSRVPAMPTLPDRVIRLIGYHVCAMAAQALSSMPDADRKKEIRAFLAISHVCREFYFNLLPAIFANLQLQVDNLSQAISATQMNGILSCVGSLSFAHGLGPCIFLIFPVCSQHSFRSWQTSPLVTIA